MKQLLYLPIFVVLIIVWQPAHTDPISIAAGSETNFIQREASVPAVTGLRAEIYNDNFAEVFWDRPVGQAFRYRVYANSVLVAETDGVSWWSQDFAPGSTTDIAIIAVDSTGEESPPATVVVQTTGGIPSPVTGLRAKVYSTTAAEIFWDRKSGLDQRYRVYANGVEVTTTDGTSWYSESFPTSSTTVVTVVAFVGATESTAQSVTVTTLGGQEPPVSGVPAVSGLRVESYDAHFIEVFWDRPFGQAYRYRIYVDGHEQGETDGVSWWMMGVDSNNTGSAEVTVIAIDENDRESQPVTAVVYTGVNFLRPVTGLRAEIYSATAAEIFWDREPGVHLYMVLADGVEVARTQGTSWFSDSFMPGSTTKLSVQAFNGPLRSPTRSVTVNTLGGMPVNPADCIGVVDEMGILYCAHPGAMELSATQADGTVQWIRPVPRNPDIIVEEAPRYVIALLLLNDLLYLIEVQESTGGPQVIFSTPITTDGVIDEAHEISQTTSVLDAPVWPPSKSPDFRPETGTFHRYNVDGSALNAIGIGNRLVLLVDRYTGGVDSVPGSIDTWEFDGGFLASIDPATGFIESSRLIAGRRIDDYLIDSQGNIQVTAGFNTWILNPDSLLTREEINGASPLFSDRPLSQITPYLVTSVIGFDLVDAEQDILRLYEKIKTTALSSEVLEIDPPDDSPPFDTGTSGSNTNYACALGGLMNVDLRSSIIDLGQGIGEKNDNTYRFEQCRVAISGGALLNGEYQLDGTFYTSHGNRNSITEDVRQWSELVVEGPDAMRTEIDARTDEKDNDFFRERARQVSITNFRKESGGAVVKSITNASADLTDNTGDFYSAVDFNRSFSGTVSGASTAGHKVTISTDQAFSNFYCCLSNVRPFVGQLQAVSDNGDELTITAMDTSILIVEPSVEYLLRNSQVQNGQADLTLTRPFTSLLIPVSIMRE